MKITLNDERCEGYGICVETAPDLMHLDPSGHLVLETEEVGPDVLARAESAARACPVAALRLVDAAE